MSDGYGQYRPPGRLRLILMFLGDQVYEFLTALGWQPREKRGTPPKRQD